MVQDQSSPSVVEVNFKALSEKKVAILDDSKLSSHNLTIKLQFIGERPVVFTTEDRRNFLEEARKGEFLAVIIGSLSNTTPVSELRFLYENELKLPIIVANNHIKAEEVSDALKENVVAFHTRPVHYERLVEGLDKARELNGLEGKSFESVIMSEAGSPLFRGLVGESQAMQSLRTTMSQLQGQTVTVLIQGEEGSGMEIVARNLHYASGRNEHEFVAVNCAALTSTTALVELFGCEPGYNWSTMLRPGHIERANGGTLYLDKVDELPLEVQARIVSYMEKRAFERMGGHLPIQADVRIIAGTCHELEDGIARKTFRSDLFYRLNVFPMNMPALRERTEDIPDLINELVSRLQHEHREPVSFDYEALLSLQRHYWPGNVRELANLVERLTIVHGNGVVTVDDLPANYQHKPARPEAVEEASDIDADEVELLPGGPREAFDASLDETARLDSENRPEVKIELEGPLNDETLNQYLNRFARNMLEVALDDAMSMESLAADRLNLSLADFTEKRRQFSL